MRRYEIDWIRNISILTLFFYHTSAIFTQFGDFYIISEQKNIIADLFILIFFIWYMPMLFFLAGASTYFSLKYRNLKEYLLERTKKLLIPFIFGLIVFVPPQTYLARVWRGENDINYFEHLKFFFSNITNFNGFDGTFTPAHLWFILYLFIVSVIGSLLIFFIIKKDPKNSLINLLNRIFFGKLNFILLIMLGLVSDLFPNIMGKSIVECFLVFIFGYITYQNEELLRVISKKRKQYFNAFLLLGGIGIIYTFLIRSSIESFLVWVIDGIIKNGILISAICSGIGFGSVYLNKKNKLLNYLNKASFPVYIIHQPILLLFAFFIIPTVKSTTLSMIIIIVSSTITTFFMYELLKKVKVFNFVLGIK